MQGAAAARDATARGAGNPERTDAALHGVQFFAKKCRFVTFRGQRSRVGRLYYLDMSPGPRRACAPRFRRPAVFARAVAVLATCLVAACAAAPPPAVPELASRALSGIPTHFSAETVAGEYQPREWWRAFGDPALDEVVETALASNLDIAQAVARVAQAREAARLARAAIFPVIGARASVEDFSSPTNAGFGAQLAELGLEELLGEVSDDYALPDRLGLATFALSADVAYEFDFWGRVENERLAAGAGYMATESDLRAVRIGILSETIAAYYEIVDLRQRIALSHETVDVLLAREEVTALRYARGLADSLDLYRVRQQLRETQEGLPQLEHRLAAVEGRLAALLGGYREELDAVLPDTLSPAAAAQPVPAGIPADLLLQRPDVQAAGHRLDSAGYSIQARRAELLPSLSLSGTIGLQTSQIGSLFNVQQWFTNLAANLLEPVFDGGRRKTRVALAEARFNELAAVYGRTVVTAVNEVEAALARLDAEGRRHDLLVARQEEAQATLDLRSERYASGVGGYPDFLDALLALLNVESALAGVQRDMVLARLAVHRALGGAWVAPDAGEVAAHSRQTSGLAE